MANDFAKLPKRPPDPGLLDMRRAIDRVSAQLVAIVEQRARLVAEIAGYKRRRGLPLRDRTRERALIEDLVANAKGPVEGRGLVQILESVIDACLVVAGVEERTPRRVDAGAGLPVVIEARGHTIARGRGCYVAGPCAVENEDQIEEVAAGLAERGVGFLRAGAFKPRTSPYAFQGLGPAGLALLAAAARRHGMASVSEATSPSNAELVAQYVDVVQIGARNMANYELLRAVGGLGRPVVLKRGFAATLEEWVGAAEYLALAGCEEIVLCERGIRTFARETRATLDLSAVPLVLASTRLPVMVDVSHAAGRRDILAPLSAAAFAAGASAVMVEVHPDPARARSDAEQQIDVPQFARLQQHVAGVLADLAHELCAPPASRTRTPPGDSRCA